MKEFNGFVGNPRFGLYVPEKGQEIYRLNAKRRLTKVPQFIDSVSGYKWFEHHGRIFCTHRIIYQTLKPEEYAAAKAENKCVDHIDNDKLNNHISNLRMVTYGENSRNRINRGGRQVLMHNPDTFETRVFLSITDAAKYLQTTQGSVTANLNRHRLFKGWYLTSTSPTQTYKYLVDDAPVENLKKAAEICGTVRASLYQYFASPNYGSKIDINGHTIERIAIKQEEIATIEQHFGSEYRRAAKRRRAEGRQAAVGRPRVN